MALFFSDASDVSKSKKPGMRMEKCLLGQQELDVPEIMMEDIRLFSDVMSQSTWDSVFSESQRQHLMTFLPSFPANDEAYKKETLELLFTGDTFKFCNPLKRFFKKMRDGIFLPDIVKYARLCRKAKEREYRYQQKLYYGRLLRELLVNRQRILDVLYCLPPEEHLTFDRASFREHRGQDQQTIEYRVQQKCHQLLAEVNEECGQGYVSSSSDGEDCAGSSAYKSQAGRWSHMKLFSTAVDLSEHSPSTVTDTFAPKSSPHHAKTSSHAHQTPGVKSTKRPHRKVMMMMLDMSDENYHSMLLKHKRRKLEDPNHPELNTEDIVLEDLIARVQTSKKPKTIGHKRKMKPPSDSAADELSDWSTVKTLQSSYSPQTVEHFGTFHSVKHSTDDIQDTVGVLSRTATSHQAVSSSHPHFFSLLKEIICSETEQKISLTKLEEKVRDWQDTGLTAGRCFPLTEPASWTGLILSAVRFLSDGILGLAQENFCPVLDFKERLQHVQWIGHGSDSENELTALYDIWLLNHGTELLQTNTTSPAVTPPPRMWTDYKVRPSTEKEKRAFQMQERERFRSPHKAFTYRIHGYEAVVGPVKGVLAKENTMKPREHAFLIKERPSYVTILTLVHECVARLPNGEGTRNDICELLKDSQFLAAGVTDSQLNSVVSGALDRLHYEKDPCVKYDVSRRLWIYRHRSRAEDEFERIHHVQCMAARAKKKALTKCKPGKSLPAAKKMFEKSLESVRTTSAAAASSAGLENLISKAAVEHLCSLDSVSVPSVKSVNSASRPMLSQTPGLSHLPFFAHTSLGTNVRGPASVLPSTLTAADSTSIVAASPKLSLASKAKPMSVSLVQQEQRPGPSLSSAIMPAAIQHQLVAGSQNAAFSLINSQLRKVADSSSLAAVVVAPPSSSTGAMVRSVPDSVVPPRLAYSLSGPRVSLPAVSSASISFSTANSPSITFASSVPPFSSVSKPVVARLMAQQRLPGVLALSGAMIRNVGVKPTAVIMTAASDTGVTSVTASNAASAATMKPYVVAAVVDPSEGVLSSQSLSIGASSSASAAGQQLAGLLRPVNTAAATNRPAHIASMPSTLPSVQFISKPVQILQSSASCAPQLLSTLPATNQRPGSSAQVLVRAKSRQPETVSQILQQTAGAGTAPARLQLPASLTDQIRPAAVPHGPPKVSVPKTPGNMRWISSLGQTRLVMPSDKGIVITQLPSESGMVRTQMFIQQRPTRTELLPQATTAGVSLPSVQPALVTPTAKLNASLQLVRALSNVSAQKLSAGPQPATYVLSATQPTTEIVQLPISSTAKPPATRPATAPIFAQLLAPGSGIRLTGLLPSDIAAVQQQFAGNSKPAPQSSVITVTTASTAPSTTS